MKKIPKSSARYKAATARTKKVKEANTLLLAEEDLKRRKKLAALAGKKVPGGKPR